MKCEKCGREMEMYYKEWCPFCDKPLIKIEIKRTLNLIKCLRHLEAIGHKGIEKRIWDKICDELINDNYYLLEFNNNANNIDSKDLKLIKETWNIQENYIEMVVSW